MASAGGLAWLSAGPGGCRQVIVRMQRGREQVARADPGQSKLGEQEASDQGQHGEGVEQKLTCDNLRRFAARSSAPSVAPFAADDLRL